MKLTEQLQKYQSEAKALLATNFYNLETLQGILQAAAEINSPLIIQLSPGSIDYIGLDTAVAMARKASHAYGVTTWLHLDHAHSVDRIQRCLDAGFDSVMIDASERSFDENIRITSEVVRMAESYSVQVEAELGYIAKLGQSTEQLGYTEPEEARRFVRETGVTSLAIAIGSAHGFYTSEPRLDMQRLTSIRDATDAFLVLHGGSGISGEQIREAVRRGICKINLATEIKHKFMQTIRQEVNKTDEIDLRFIFPPAISAVKNLVKDKLKMIQA